MKKLILAIALFALADAANAQDFVSTPRIGQDKKFFIMPIDHIGWGMAIPQALDAPGNAFSGATSFGRNREFFLNLAAIEFSPYSSGYFMLGADIAWSNYRLDKTHFWYSPAENAVDVASADGLYSAVNSSRLRVLSFVFPLDYSQRLGPVLLTLGAGAELNLPASIRFKGLDTGGEKVKNAVKGIDTELFTYNFHAVVSYYGLGLYVKYRPVAQFKSGSGPLFTSWSAGLYFR